MAGAFWQLGKYDQGVDYSKKAIQANPNIKEGHYNLAVNLIMKGRLDEAVAVLEALIRKNGQYLAARFMLAAALSMAGDGKKGRELFSELKNEMSGQVLSIGVEDLVQKMKNSGRSDYADAIKEAVCKT
jgi:tetratricopeptide (TPR) repeat protein